MLAAALAVCATGQVPAPDAAAREAMRPEGGVARWDSAQAMGIPDRLTRERGHLGIEARTGRKRDSESL
jgi:hypothetical protein